MSAANRQRAARQAAATRRLLSLYAATDAETREQGRGWYRDAADQVAKLATPELPPDRAAAIVAVLSPRERWRRNLQMAAAIITGNPVTGLGRSIAKAQAIMDGAEITGEPGDALGADAPKVRSFWRNLCGDGDAVTVDVWATRAATGKDLDAPPTPAAYRWIADAYRSAAAKVGERPCDFQAIIWLHVRPSAEHARDQAATIGAIHA